MLPVGIRETQSRDPERETANRTWVVCRAMPGVSRALKLETCQKRDVEAELLPRVKSTGWGGERYWQRTQLRKGPEERDSRAHAGVARLLCLEPREKRRSAGPDREGLTKRRTKGSRLRSENTGESLRDF